jgi:uncharacterized protein (DUF58 family)
MTSPPVPRKLRRIDRWLAANGRSLEITKAGWLHIALCLGVGFAAINSGSNLLHLLFGCQMGLVVISGILSERMLARAHVDMQAKSGCEARTPCPLRVTIHNRSPRSPLFATSVELPRDHPFEQGQLMPAFCMYVGPARSSATETNLVLPKRGWTSLPDCEVVTSFPFGLFIKRRRFRPEQKLLVRPYCARHLNAFATHDAHDGLGEGASKPDRAGEIVGLNEYREGADRKRIDWKAFARKNRLFIREFIDHEPHAIDLRLAPGQIGESDFEASIETIAGLAQEILMQSDRSVSLRYGDTVLVERGTGSAQLETILDALALVGEKTES